jgi:uncharacterized protein YlxP (DUF503 family)
MPVAVLTLQLRIEHARSLKDRRQVVRSLKEQLAHGFNISIAELDGAVTWQSATLGIAAISGSRDYLAGQMLTLEAAATRMTGELGAEIADAWWEFLEAESAPDSPVLFSHGQPPEQSPNEPQEIPRDSEASHARLPSES